MEKEKVLVAKGIVKTFGSTQALSDVNISLESGKVMGLIGENGSGKSTFATICAGIQKADRGVMTLNGEEYRPTSAIDAVNHGVSIVVQEQGTISGITVAANIFLGKEKMFRKNGFLVAKDMEAQAQKLLDEIGADAVHAACLVDELSFEDRKLVELARSLYCRPKLWIVDETTTALSASGREILYRLMEKVRGSGGAVLFISHDLEEIQRVCDCLTILRDGVVTATLDKQDFEEEKIKCLMIGREMSSHYYRDDISGACGEAVALEARGISGGILHDVSFSLHQGEILGLGGLNDCGMHEIGKILAGLDRPVAGDAYLHGTERVENISWAIAHGIGYVSKNRDSESLMPVGSIRDNIDLPSLDKVSHMHLLSKKKERAFAQKWADQLEVKANSVDEFCNALSGGNKQKVVLAKWLGKDSAVLILDCPTRGIDIKTKASIYALIEQLKRSGKSILLISEELPELIGMSDRIVILKNGRISGEFRRENGMTEAKLIQKMI